MLRKIAEIKVPTGAGPREVKTKNVFATYDKQSAGFAFYFSDMNISDATATLLFIIDGKKVFLDEEVKLEATNETHTFNYLPPDELMNYAGEVDGYLYFNFPDGSQSDEIHFVFTIKKSQIDEAMEDVPDVYIKSFEEIKEDLKNQAKQMAADGKKEIDSKVAEVESSKDNAIEDIHNVIPTVENEIADVKDLWNQQKTDMVVGGRNLLTGTSNDWEIAEFSGYTYGQMTYVMDKKSPLKIGDSVTYSLEIDNSLSENGTNAQGFVSFVDSGGANIKELKTAVIKPGEVKEVSATAIVPEGTVRILAFKIRKLDGKNNQKIGVRKNNLQRGISTDWQPAPEDYYAEMDKIKQAIINLGGSV